MKNRDNRQLIMNRYKFRVTRKNNKYLKNKYIFMIIMLKNSNFKIRLDKIHKYSVIKYFILKQVAR